VTRTGGSFVAVLVALLLEVSSVGHFGLGGRASFLLVVLLLSSLFLDTKEAVLLGSLSGLVLDLSIGHLLGMHVLTYAAVCFCVCRMQSHFFKESMVLAVVVGLVGTLVYYVLSGLLLFLIAPRHLPGEWFLSKVALNAVLNAIWTVLLYPVMFRLSSGEQAGSWGRGKSVE
jgi:rod shape-determining protein MreD